MQPSEAFGEGNRQASRERQDRERQDHERQDHER